MWKYGLNALWEAGPISLAARTLPAGPASAINTNGTNGLNQMLYVFPPGTVLPDGYYFVYAFKLSPHFPYGYAVEPDVHT